LSSSFIFETGETLLGIGREHLISIGKERTVLTQERE